MENFCYQYIKAFLDTHVVSEFTSDRMKEVGMCLDEIGEDAEVHRLTLTQNEGSPGISLTVLIDGLQAYGKDSVFFKMIKNCDGLKMSDCDMSRDGVFLMKMFFTERN